MRSFDVFDTLITRRTAAPEGIFALMQERLLREPEFSGVSEYVKSNFYLLRLNAERMARADFVTEESQEIILEQIYRCLASTGCLTDEEADRLMGLERGTELDNVVGIAENIEKVKSLVSRGERVVLISEMYLDTDTVRGMLAKADPALAEVPLYVSSQYKRTKTGGGLYRAVQELEQADWAEWIHTGDNARADGAAPRELGIQTELFAYPSLLPYESALLERCGGNASIQLQIGAARNCRLLHPLSETEEIGCSFAGPLFTGYVDWLLCECGEKNIDRLYFIARDGYLLREIADAIIEARELPIRTSYLYGSRKAWRMASVSGRTDLHRLLFIAFSGTEEVVSLEKYAAVFEMPLKDFERFLPSAYVYKERLSEWEKREVDRRLSEDASFMEYLLERHRDKRALFRRYLEQEMDLSDGCFAFVELSGSGYTQGCLAEVLGELKDYPVRTFFYKLDWVGMADNCVNYNYLPTNLELGYMIEVLCRALHGPTNGYKSAGERVEPVLERAEGQALAEHGYEGVIKGVRLFASEYAASFAANTLGRRELSLPLFYLQYLTGFPDKKLLDFAADMPFSVSGRDKRVTRFAPRLTKRQILEIYFLRYPRMEPASIFYEGASPEYALLRGSRLDRWLARKGAESGDSGPVKTLAEKRGRRKYFYKYKNNDFTKYRLPENLGGRVAIYAAGNLGKCFYAQLRRRKGVCVTAWVDKNAGTLRKEGLPAEDVGVLWERAFDTLLIAVVSPSAAAAIIKELIDGGIPGNKLLWLDIGYRYRPRRTERAVGE